MSWWRISFVVVAMSLTAALSSPAGAAPAGLGELKAAAASGTSMTQVHWRRHHCYWHHGRRHCHRRYYRHGYWPGVHLYIGRRHYHHYRHHHHRWH